MTAQCIQIVQKTFRFLPLNGRKVLNIPDTLRAALLNRERLFCCRDSKLSAYSLNRGACYRTGIGVAVLPCVYWWRDCNSSHKTLQACVSRLHDSRNKPQLPSGFKCGVPIDDVVEVACNFTSFPARSEGVVRFHPTERNGLGRNDGLQNHCRARRS